MTDATSPQPADACHPIEVDGETIRVHGSGEMTEQDEAFFGEVVRAAKRKYQAEHGAQEPAAGEEHAAGTSATCPVCKDTPPLRYPHICPGPDTAEEAETQQSTCKCPGELRCSHHKEPTL